MKLTFLIFTLSLTVIFLCRSMSMVSDFDYYLLTAAFSTNLDKAQESLLNGANVNVINKNGSTPLHYAAEGDCTELVKLLLSAYANVNIQDNYSYNTPLHRAIKYGRIEAVKLLVEHGTDMMLKDIKNRTVLDLAKEKNNFDILKILEEYPLLRQEAQEKATKETLRKAIQGNYPNLVKLLLQKGVIADIHDLKLAKELDHQEIGHMLIQYLGATTGQYTIAKNGILNLGLPAHIAQHSMSHAL